MNMKEYVTRRNKLVSKMDIEGMKELHEDAAIPLPASDFSITAGMHIIKVKNAGFSEEEKRNSMKWLTDNGFSEYAQYADVL